MTIVAVLPYNYGMDVTATQPEVADRVRYNVRAARDKSGMKQYQFALKLGISKSYLSDLERGLYSPSPELFAKICRLVGSPPDEFVYL